MISFLLALVFLAVAFLTATLRKVYFAVPKRELKRQAAEGNQAARELWQAVAYGRSLRVLLWIVLTLFGAWGLVLLGSVTNGLVAVIVGMLALWLLFSWLPGTRVSATAIRFAHTVNPSVVWVLQHIEPLLHRVEKPILKHYKPHHSGLYELRDLLDLLDLQAAQSDNRIATEQLLQVRAALEFGDRKVRDVVRLNAKTVALTDAIGPILLDELHAAGQVVFPVTRTPRAREIVGCVFVEDLSIKSEGTVADYTSMGTLSLRENLKLTDALQEFLKTKKQLAVVVDAADEFVGTLTLADIMAVLLPEPPKPAVDAAGEVDADNPQE